MTAAELKAWRISTGLREVDIANMFGFTEQEVKDYERGRVAVPSRLNRQIKRSGR